MWHGLGLRVWLGICGGDYKKRRFYSGKTNSICVVFVSFLCYPKCKGISLFVTLSCGEYINIL